VRLSLFVALELESGVLIEGMHVLQPRFAAGCDRSVLRSVGVPKFRISLRLIPTGWCGAQSARVVAVGS